MDRSIKIVVLMGIMFAALVCCSPASANWNGSYSDRATGTSVGGGVTNGWASPMGYDHTGLAWGSLGLSEHSVYGLGVTGGVGPNGGGGIGIKLPTMAPFQLKW
jgi:hypothetical protein